MVRILLIILLLAGCASNPELGPCGLFLKADRKVNEVVFNGDPNKTITTEQLAEKDHKVLCSLTNVVMLPYDLFCAKEVFNHCEYWKEYEESR